ncbi:MAG TPA: hypothetical protein VFI09_09905 [Solirubrobacterales bacterium]|nr:hypothetical protein [Solirubrobacterales bacterium]
MALMQKLAKPNGQIKSRDRVRDLAEVYTHEREINAMLALVPDMFPTAQDPGNTDRTFLEPACGHGNFLVEILRRKLRFVTPQRYGRGERFEHRVLRCLASVYGIDICEENVRESRERMRAVIDAHIQVQLSDGPTTGFVEAVETILATNVICADTLADAAEVELVEYKPGSGSTFTRGWSRPLATNAGEPNLFSLAAPRCDQVPVHYSALASQTEPAVGSTQKKAA